MVAKEFERNSFFSQTISHKLGGSFARQLKHVMVLFCISQEFSLRVTPDVVQVSKFSLFEPLFQSRLNTLL